MKSCIHCGIEKAEKEFKTYRYKGQLRYKGICRSCNYEQVAAKRERLREKLDAYKASHGCINCGFRDSRALDFHHVSEKRFGIGSAVSASRSEKLIWEEVSKCVVLCANCHRIEHAEERMASRVD